jgi:hypothetical protein
MSTEGGHLTMHSRHRVLAAAIPVLLLISVGFNVLQAKRIEDLLHASPMAGRVGAPAGAIVGTALNGAPVRIAVDAGQPTLVYYFKTTCGWCERNWHNVQALADAAQDGYRLVAVTSEPDVAAFARSRGFTFEVVQDLSNETRRHFGFKGTPHAVLVSAQGLVSHEWLGAFQGGAVRQIEDLFGIVLPGLGS